MSNNKQSMKLYTEEELCKAMDFARGYHKMTDSQFIDSLTPIELPSDEEIEDGSRNYIKGTYFDTIVERTFFKAGAKWMREQIQGGNNEQN